MLCLSLLLLHYLPSPHTTLSLLNISECFLPSLGISLTLLHTDTAVSNLLGPAPLPTPLSSVLILPLVQLLSQPPSTLHLLDHTHILSEGRGKAESLLKQIEASDNLCGEGWGSDGSPVCSSDLSEMAVSVQQYLCVVRHPALAKVWLEGVVQETTKKACDHRVLLVFRRVFATGFHHGDIDLTARIACP